MGLIRERGRALASPRLLLTVGILALAFSTSFMIRSQAMDHGFQLNEFDPFFHYRATQYIVDNGIPAYLDWHDTMSWHPEGRDMSQSQNMLHYTAAATYQVFGGGSGLYNYTIMFPVVVGSLTAVVVFALVRVIGGTAAGLVAALLFSVSPAIIIRGTVGWFKSEPLGLFYGLLAVYLFLSGIGSRGAPAGVLKMAGAGVLLAFALSAWGGTQFFLLPIGIFMMALPFLRRDHRFQAVSVPVFTAALMSASLLFDRPGAGFITSFGGFAVAGPTVFLVACCAVQAASRGPARLRNGLLLLAGSAAAGASVVALSFSAGLLSVPPYRYLNALNPFMTTNDPLVDSIAEHSTSMLNHSFFFMSILMVFAAVGAWMIIRGRPRPGGGGRGDMAAFALIMGATGVYASSSFLRLELFASASIIILSSLGISALVSGMLAGGRARPGRPPLRLAAPSLAGIVVLLSAPLALPGPLTWTTVVDAPPTILNGGTIYDGAFTDWPSALFWLQANTPPDSVVAAWWDYGYWITAVADRTTIVDNATIRSDRIEEMARMFLAAPDDSWRMLMDMEADYAVVFVAAQVIASDPNRQFYQLIGGGEESKKASIIAIAQEPAPRHLHPDGISGTPHFWDNTMLGRMIPFELAAYYDAAAQLPSETYRDGLVPLYVRSVKLAAEDDPLRLVYASPSYESSPTVVGVFVYEVNKDYSPRG